MGRTAKRLSVHSSTSPEPAWDLTEGQYQALEAILSDSPFQQECRVSLVAGCRRYLFWRTVELGAGKLDEALQIWRTAKSNIESFIALGEGAFPPFTDAGRTVENAIFDGLESVSIQLTERDLEPATLDPLHSAGDAPVNGLHLNISRSFLMRLAGALRVAVANADAKLAKSGEGFRPGQAFSEWLGDMRAWSAKYGHPFGAGTANEPSKFVEFLHTLHGTFPSEIRDPVNSVEAMKERLRRYIRESGSNSS